MYLSFNSTLKNDVKNELAIPAQTRYLVPIQLGRIERQVYEQELEKALDELGLDANGIAATEGWVVDTTVLRSWVRKLRGITTHPQVGSLTDRTERLLSKAGGLKSITEVLDDMRLTTHRTVLDGRRQRVELLIREARLGQQSQSPNRYQDARALLLAGNDHIQALIQDLRDEITAHDKKGNEMKQGRSDAQKETEGSESRKQRDESPQDEADEYSTGIPKTPAGTAWIHARAALVGRLREAQLVHHKVQFFLGDIYHILAPDSLEERQAYQAAENMRNQLLAGMPHLS
jgi:E3 ubiquitin-protein ligase SHPRH